MITHVLSLTRWEWYKLRRHRMAWILLAIAIVMTQIAFWGGYASYRSGVTFEQAIFAASETQNGQTVQIIVTCGDIEAGTLPPEIDDFSEERRRQLLEDIARFEADACQALIEARRELREALTLPYSIGLSLGLVSSLGAILVVILASSTIGIEYGLGTLRTTLSKGIGRWQFIVSKALLLTLLSAAALLVVSLSIAVSSTIAALTLGDAAVAADSGAWPDVAIVYGKTVYGLIPYVVLAMFFAVLTSSSGVGIAIVLGYYFAERIVVAILFNFDWFKNVADFVLGRAVDGWISSDGGLSIELGTSAGELPDALHGFLVMLGYILILGALTFWLFQRRDITGAKGD